MVIAVLWAALLITAVPGQFLSQSASAQDETEPAGATQGMVDAADIQSVMNDEPTQELGSDQPSGIDLLSLIARGGRL
ncbi:MAG: MotA/TolQ/ExbB proton channel family protein, partial [Rhodopirellula bahusiensis]